ncbi:MAG: ABC transporter ATP-binding protein [Candidatus Omnitrophica bacterium]|nr:ABC transporter ATP-binding protein [Candidatus Omnitrophota bacterium]
MKNYLKMLQFLKGHERLFAVAIVIIFFSSFFEVFQIGLAVPLVDIIFTGKEIVVPNENLPQFIKSFVAYLNDFKTDRERALMLFPFVAIFLIIIKNFLIFAYSFVMSDISQRVMRDIRFKLYEKIQSLSMDYFSERRTGELSSRITYDANIIENAVSYGLIDLFKQTFVIIACILTVFAIYPFGALLIFIFIPPIAIPMSSIGKKLKSLTAGQQEKMADINSHLLETISGVKLVKAFCTENFEIKKFGRQNYEFYKLKMKAVKRLIVISPITEIFASACACVMLWFLGQRVLTEELSFGIFGLFLGSFMTMISPIKKLGNVNALIQSALSANERIYEVLDEQASVVEKKDAKKIKELSSGIVLERISFHYKEESGQVLDNIDLEIKKGELVAIVGPTGTGKSTLVNLVPRFYDPTAGRILIDGVDLKEVSFNSLRRQMGIVTQESILFNDTVRNNIAYGYPEASQKEIEEAAQRAFAHQFITKMPKGYDTIIGDRGFRLSGGEKQRISIARAILKNPPILILDEATSQLDSESEKYVQEALDLLMQGRTVIAIAHRLSTIKKASKIVVLEHGKIVGIGKHSELLESCALYQKLHGMQFQA